MPSHSKTALMIICLIFTGCTKMQDSASQDLDAAGTETSASYNKIRDYLDVGHKAKPKEQVKAVPRYCYHTYEDIICYSKPLPGEEYRLVGFQTSAGKTGYVMTPPPPTDTSNADDLPPLKSVTVGPPPQVKTAEKPHLKEIIFDPAELEPKELVPDKMQ